MQLARRISMTLRVACGVTVFGVGAVLLTLLLFPVTRLRLNRQVPPEIVGQSWVACAFRLFVGSGRLFGLWRIEMMGLERLATPGALIIANHPTLLDVVILLGFIPQADCVVKSAAWRNPVLMGIVRATGYVPNDGGEATINACVERLSRGRSLMLFPEGSRSPREGLLNFQRGAAHIALRSGATVVPVVIESWPTALKRDTSFWDYPLGGIDYRVKVGAPQAVVGNAVAGQSTPLEARALTAQWRAHFEARLDDPE